MRAIKAGVLSCSLVATALVAGCGGSPAGPSAVPSLTPGMSLTPGAYILKLSQTDGMIASPYGTFWASLCAAWGGGGSGGASVTVDLQQAETGWLARTADGRFTLTLKTDQGTVVGEMSGVATAIDGTTRVTAGDGQTQKASVSGSVTGVDTVGGRVDGHLQFSDGTGGSSCSDNAWLLSRR